MSLATIQKVKNVRPCPNSDNLELVDVLGWQVVVKKGEFKPDDLCIYVTIDTVLPEDNPNFEFLRTKHFRIKPIKLRGEPSNGICFPLSILHSNIDNLDIDTDVTEILNIKKYEKPVPAQLAGQIIGGFPSFIIKTDEKNIRDVPHSLNELRWKSYYISVKVDGSSGTFFIKDGSFGVCSRNINLKEDPNNGFWKIANKYNLKNVLPEYFPSRNVAIQGEVYGEEIQKNPTGTKGIDLVLFNLFDIDTQRYFNYDELVTFSTSTNIPMVSVIEHGENFGYSVEDLLKIANGLKYSNNSWAEGLVLRPKFSFYSRAFKKDWSGKIINENYKE